MSVHHVHVHVSLQAKHAAEEAQRAERAALLAAGATWQPQLFECVRLPPPAANSNHLHRLGGAAAEAAGEMGWIPRAGALDLAFDADFGTP